MSRINQIKAIACSDLSCGKSIMLYKVVRPFKSMDKTLEYNHSSESYWAVLSCGTVYFAIQGGSNLSVGGWNVNK